MSGGVLAWLSVRGKVQICIRPSWCHCHSLSLALVNPDWFYIPGFIFLVPAHPDSPGQNPESCEMVVVVVVVAVPSYLLTYTHIHLQLSGQIQKAVKLTMLNYQATGTHVLNSVVCGLQVWSTVYGPLWEKSSELVSAAEASAVVTDPCDMDDDNACITVSPWWLSHRWDLFRQWSSACRCPRSQLLCRTS